MSQTNSTTAQLQSLMTSNEQLLALAQTIVESQNTKVSLKDKLKSRKFWMSVAGFVAGLMGMIGCKDNVIALAVFGIVEIVSILVYCFSEGTVDSARAKNLAEATATFIEMLGQVISENNTMIAVYAENGILIPDDPAADDAAGTETGEGDNAFMV
ncbi:MAG: hypothetical protein NC311_05545 [Muribaculaceae bacterium]|nr:hypothetical protein [Muribaculaceae bacterium]